MHEGLLFCQDATYKFDLTRFSGSYRILSISYPSYQFTTLEDTTRQLLKIYWVITPAFDCLGYESANCSKVHTSMHQLQLQILDDSCHKVNRKGSSPCYFTLWKAPQLLEEEDPPSSNLLGKYEGAIY